MEFYYKKNNNDLLFKTLENTQLLNVKNVQNYNPIYQNFFTLNEKNYNNINLNQTFNLFEILKKKTYNKHLCYLENENQKENQKIEKNVFFKLSPLLDPIKYITEKYDIHDKNLLNLPDYHNNCHDKIADNNNSAYVDGFFTYLTSKLLHNNGFIHGIDFYGSFLAHKNDFVIDISDDLEYLNDSKEFHKNNGVLYEIDNDFYSELINYDTRKFKKKLVWSDRVNIENNIIELSNINDLSEINDMFIKSEERDKTNNEEVSVLYESNIVNKKSSLSKSLNSECSSRSSNTLNEEDSIQSEYDNEDTSNTLNTLDDLRSESDNEESSNNLSYSEASQDETFIRIRQFPVNVIALETCENTLDSLLMNEDLTDDMLGSIIIQIIMMLITYQKVFNLTHNDLHTNNVMYVNTDKEFLYYRYDNKYYKVPTFGRIFKIIDFGRAIYKFRGSLICSDSYHPEGDAATQYNFEPYFDETKPRLEPNFSFDLCRLGCAIYDEIMNDGVNEEESPIKEIIKSWCFDDKGRNVLYKKNGDERYPDFKLYKMIARTVHNHVPKNVLKNTYFDKYIISKKSIKRKKNIINIDAYDIYK